MLAITATTLVACNSNDERISENSKKESEIVSQSQIQAENDYVKAQSSTLESDLRNRFKFYDAINGMYSGDLKIGGESYKIRMIFTANRSVPDFTPFRPFRRIDEVIYDLNNLGLNVQIYQWKSNQPLAGVTCQVDDIKPELKKGKIVINTKACPNFYELVLSDEFSSGTSSADISADIFADKLDQVIAIKGIMAPSSSSEVYKFSLKAEAK